MNIGAIFLTYGRERLAAIVVKCRIRPKRSAVEVAIDAENCSAIVKGWEHLVLLASSVPGLIFLLGGGWGGFAVGSVLVAYLVMRRLSERSGGRFVCLLLMSATLLLFVSFFRLWMGRPCFRDSSGWQDY
jgi:hypothetical protein